MNDVWVACIPGSPWCRLSTARAFHEAKEQAAMFCSRLVTDVLLLGLRHIDGSISIVCERRAGVWKTHQENRK